MSDDVKQKLVRLTTVQLAWLRRVAAENGCSVSQVLRMLVMAAMKEQNNA